MKTLSIENNLPFCVQWCSSVQVIGPCTCMHIIIIIRVYMFRPVAQPLPGYANRMACCITGWPVV